MQAIGRKGGSGSPLTRLRKSADDDLREQARQVLSDALAGKSVDKQQLDAARSLFSYRADSPPERSGELGEYAGPLVDGRRPTSLAHVVRFAVSLGTVAHQPELVTACREVVAAAERVPPAGVSRESRSGS